MESTNKTYKIEQLYLTSLSIATYYIHSKGEAVIIDPLRDIGQYLEILKKDGTKLKYVMLTHIHADFVSGHFDLAKKTGATIVFGPSAKAGFEFHEAKDGEVFKIGGISLAWLHTPGHTMESSSMVLADEKGKKVAVFTGDTVFIDDVGRPDLAVSKDITKEDLAGFLYDSITNKILTLPDDIIIYPNHGAGSACGKKLSKKRSDTLGNQKKNNYALNFKNKEEFVKDISSGISPPPQYFLKMGALNKSSMEPVSDIVKRGAIAIEAKKFKELLKDESYLLIDTRPQEDFQANGFILGSLWIGIRCKKTDNLKKFETFVGKMVNDLKQKVLFVAHEGYEAEVVKRLARVGYDNPVGYLKGGIPAWKEEGFELATFDVTPTTQLFDNPDFTILDVRPPKQYSEAHIKNAQNSFVGKLIANHATFAKDKVYVVHCNSGYMATLGISILKRYGINVRILEHHMLYYKKIKGLIE